MFVTREDLMYSDILRLLECLDVDFARRLSEQLDLHEYSKKLEVYAEFVTARCEDNSIVGLIAYYTNNISHEYYIPYVCVCANHRRMGIADALLSEFCRIADDNGMVVSLEVRVDNKGAINLYRKYGFNIVVSNDVKHLMKRVIELT
ncbi:MAG: N-acetyltransferase [Bacteroidaceae bacterium]